MHTDTRFNLTPQLILGVCLILFGTLLTLDRLNVLDAAVSFRYWPVVLIALGVWIVIERGPTGRRFPGIALIVVGWLLLLNTLGVLEVRVSELFLPAIILFVGARLLMQTPGRMRERHRVPGMPAVEGRPAPAGSDATVSMFAILGGDRRASTDKAFRGGDITSFMGSTHLDLRQAAIAPGEQAVINIFAFMGGHELWVPSGWNVSIEVIPLLGGVEDKRLPPVLDATPRAPNEAASRLVLRGVVVMGGLAIKN